MRYRAGFRDHEPQHKNQPHLVSLPNAIRGLKSMVAKVEKTLRKIHWSMRLCTRFKKLEFAAVEIRNALQENGLKLVQSRFLLSAHYKRLKAALAAL